MYTTPLLYFSNEYENVIVIKAFSFRPSRSVSLYDNFGRLMLIILLYIPE